MRHGLLAVGTIAATSREVYGRMVRLAVFDAAGAAQLDDLEDQFRRVAAMADSQREYLQGVIEFYQTRTNTDPHVGRGRVLLLSVAADHPGIQLIHKRTLSFPARGGVV